jgi:hypothetical protein
MKLHDRHHVEGTTTPAIYIGHRQYKGRDGKVRVSKKWFAEYNWDAKKFSEPLRTTNKQAATGLRSLGARRG